MAQLLQLAWLGLGPAGPRAHTCVAALCARVAPARPQLSVLLANPTDADCGAPNASAVLRTSFPSPLVAQPGGAATAQPISVGPVRRGRGRAGG
jgi:hypothetical protein